MAYSKLARRLKFLIASYERHGARHVVDVFRHERIRRSYARSPIPLPDHDAFMRSFAWYRDPATFVDDFHRAAARRLPFTRANRREFHIDLLLRTRPYDDILTDAEKISEGKFSGLGVCIDEPSGRFDWSRDYSSAKSWPPARYNAIRFMDDDGSDVKYPWELSRMYWLGWLGNAYWVSNNGAWSREFLRLVDDWREANPIDTGVNWAMPMEVAIRGFWLALGYCYFSGAPNIPGEWWIDYLRMAWGHGTHLVNNLEYLSNLTNHYISNCFGLLALGVLFADSPEGRHWLEEGRRRLIEELDHQVLPDGVHYERSIGYHGLVLEIYLIAAVMAERAGVPFPEKALAKIELMAEFMRDYIPPAGTVPQLGDSDDGVILRLSDDQELYDHRGTMSLAAALFRREDFRRVAGDYSIQALTMLGSEGFERERGMAPGAQLLSRLYRDGGFAILRSGSLHLLADVGEIGLHGNNDTLSFTLGAADGAIFIDPGTYCYTRDPALRNELRSTRAHDTPMLDAREIAEFDNLWRVKRDATAVEILAWSAGDTTVLEARHHAYDDLPSGAITVHRRWELAGDELRVTDRFEGAGRHECSVRFTVPRERRVTKVSERIVEIAGEATTLRLECSRPLTVRPGWYSPSYGVAVMGTYIEWAGGIDATDEISYLCRLSKNPDNT
jgi:hypothetical protein